MVCCSNQLIKVYLAELKAKYKYFVMLSVAQYPHTHPAPQVTKLR
jgi:hypothetical protein